MLVYEWLMTNGSEESGACEGPDGAFMVRAAFT